MARVRGITSAISLIVIVTPAQVLEARQQPPPQPTVAVAGFVLDSAARLSPKAVDAMADGLALQLVESGRYRVLDRSWLGVDSWVSAGDPISRIRDAAQGAGVDYLVVGRIARFRESRRSAPPIVPQRAPFGRPRPGYAGPLSRPIPPNHGMTHLDQLRLTLELLDTRTGELLTETSSTCAVPPKSGLAGAAPLALLPTSPIAAAVALVAKSRASSAVLDPGLERALTTAGMAIIRWTPPSEEGR